MHIPRHSFLRIDPYSSKRWWKFAHDDVTVALDDVTVVLDDVTIAHDDVTVALDDVTVTDHVLPMMTSLSPLTTNDSDVIKNSTAFLSNMQHVLNNSSAVLSGGLSEWSEEGSILETKKEGSISSSADSVLRHHPFFRFLLDIMWRSEKKNIEEELRLPRQHDADRACLRYDVTKPATVTSL